jgi:hypothetical protein
VSAAAFKQSFQPLGWANVSAVEFLLGVGYRKNWCLRALSGSLLGQLVVLTLEFQTRPFQDSLEQQQTFTSSDQKCHFTPALNWLVIALRGSRVY